MTRLVTCRNISPCPNHFRAGSVHTYVRVYVHTYVHIYFLRSRVSLSSAEVTTPYSTHISRIESTLFLQNLVVAYRTACSHFTELSAGLSLNALPLRYTQFTSRRGRKYPGMSQLNTQRSGMQRQKTLPHIIHCCHVATLKADSHMACLAHAVPLIHTCHAPIVPCPS